METMFRRSMFTSFTWYSQQFRGNIWQTVFPSKTTTAKWKSRYKLYLRKSHNDCYLLCWLSMRREYDSTHTGYKYEDRNERWVWKMHNVQDKKIRTKSLIMHFTSRNGVPGWLRGAVVATCRMDPISCKSLNQDIYTSKYISSTFSKFLLLLVFLYWISSCCLLSPDAHSTCSPHHLIIWRCSKKLHAGSNHHMSLNLHQNYSGRDL